MIKTLPWWRVPHATLIFSQVVCAVLVVAFSLSIHINPSESGGGVLTPPAAAAAQPQ